MAAPSDFVAFVKCAQEERRHPGRLNACLSFVDTMAAVNAGVDDRPAVRIAVERVEAVARVATRIGKKFGALRTALVFLRPLLDAMDADDAALTLVDPTEAKCLMTGVASDAAVRVSTKSGDVTVALSKGEALDFCLRAFCYRRFWERIVEHADCESVDDLYAEFERNESVVEAATTAFT